MNAVYQRLRRLARSRLPRGGTGTVARVVAGVVGALAAGAAVASCAPLVSYDGFRGGDADVPADDGGVDAEKDATANVDARAGDAAADGGKDPCSAAVPGTYCGRSLPGYGGGTQDLVRCLGDGKTGSVTACAAGCSSMPNGRQDVCNPCAARGDGKYCLHELIVDYPSNDVIVTCGANAAQSAAVCPLVCTASACR